MQTEPIDFFLRKWGGLNEGLDSGVKTMGRELLWGEEEEEEEGQELKWFNQGGKALCSAPWRHDMHLFMTSGRVTVGA